MREENEQLSNHLRPGAKLNVEHFFRIAGAEPMTRFQVAVVIATTGVLIFARYKIRAPYLSLRYWSAFVAFLALSIIAFCGGIILMMGMTNPLPMGRWEFVTP